LPRQATAAESHLLTTLAEIAGSAIQRSRLHAQTARRLEQLQSLHAIDVAITSSFNLRATLALFLEHMMTRLHVDACSILLLDKHTGTLEYAEGRGFRTRSIEKSRLSLGEGHAGRAALEKCLVFSDFGISVASGARTQLLAEEGFISHFAVPLIAKGEVKGVLDIFQRSRLDPDAEWLEFMEALAGQAAVAVDNATLYNDLQLSNTELTQAYDMTIIGWSRALDLRDKETEGHAQRVTEMAVRLARALGMSEEDLAHVRRGALLHDIGKMGVPDAILLKPGSLTDSEWGMMRKHPTYAFEMLSPIPYLQFSLDIPYCHHEKWDGTGYPRGLRGEKIPLAARIFAIVDVFDALTNDRPYRPAWTQDRAMEHIRAESGKHFDPDVVDLFFRTMTKEI
jgi:putative nucleotidyltransferase with HDIG domain